MVNPGRYGAYRHRTGFGRWTLQVNEGGDWRPWGSLVARFEFYVIPMAVWWFWNRTRKSKMRRLMLGEL